MKVNKQAGGRRRGYGVMQLAESADLLGRLGGGCRVVKTGTSLHVILSHPQTSKCFEEPKLSHHHSAAHFIFIKLSVLTHTSPATRPQRDVVAGHLFISTY